MATKAEQYRAKVELLDSLGSASGQVELQDLTPLEAAAGDFIQRVQDNINREKDMVTTGKIAEMSIQLRGDEVQIIANPHLIYQSRGVSGTKTKYNTPHSYKDKKPPVQPFIEWIKNKKIVFSPKNDNKRKYDDRLSDSDKSKPAPFANTGEDDIISVAYAVRETVYQHGIKPKDLYEKEIPKLVEGAQELYEDFVLQQINQMVNINPREGGKNRIVLNL